MVANEMSFLDEKVVEVIRAYADKVPTIHWVLVYGNNIIYNATLPIAHGGWFNGRLGVLLETTKTGWYNRVVK